jgi:hypothetical protein
MQAYTNALAGVTAAPRVEIGASRSRPGSVAAAVALYFGSMAFGSLAPSTQRNLRWDARKIQSTTAIRTSQPCSVIASSVRVLNPTDARNFTRISDRWIIRAQTYRHGDGDHGAKRLKEGMCSIWLRAPKHEFNGLTQFEGRHAIGSKARLAFGLLLYTAQRRGDVIPMGRQHIKDGFIRVTQQKPAPCSKSRSSESCRKS